MLARVPSSIAVSGGGTVNTNVPPPAPLCFEQPSVFPITCGMDIEHTTLHLWRNAS